MKLAGFRYFKSRRLLTLALLVTLSSTLFSMTAFTLMGYYRGLYAYLGEGENVIAIYDRKSRTPFTGIVPAYLAETVGRVNGVLAVSPEVIIPCVVKDQSVFLRGIIPENFLKLNQLTVVRGEMLGMEDLNSAMVGERIAERLNLNPGDRILVTGVLADNCFELQVKGVFRSDSPIDDELIAPLHVGQWLRGVGYSQVTLIRVKIDRSLISQASIYEAIAKVASEPESSSGSSQKPSEQPIMPWTWLRFQAGSIGVEEAQKFMEGYMERYGVSRESLLILSAMVFLFSSATVALAAETVIVQHEGELAVLRSIGSSKRLLKADILVKLLPLSAAASLVGVIAAMTILSVIQGYGCLQVLSHAAPLQLDPMILALNFILVLLLVSSSVLHYRMDA